MNRHDRVVLYIQGPEMWLLLSDIRRNKNGQITQALVENGLWVLRIRDRVIQSCKMKGCDGHIPEIAPGVVRQWTLGASDTIREIVVSGEDTVIQTQQGVDHFRKANYNEIIETAIRQWKSAHAHSQSST